MEKKLNKYSKSFVTRALNSVSSTRLRSIKESIKIGNGPETIAKDYSIKLSWAIAIHQHFTEVIAPEITVPDIGILGYKTEAYSKNEFPEKPVYKLEDLEAEEKVIAKKDTSTKLWTWEE